MLPFVLKTFTIFVIMPAYFFSFMMSSFAILFNTDGLCRLTCDSGQPICLKKYFGIVGENGWLLTFNPTIDTPSLTPGTRSNTVQLSGHFYDILHQQAMTVLIKAQEIVQRLHLRLEEGDVKNFSENPEQFLRYLDTIQNHNFPNQQINQDGLKTSIDMLKLSFAQYRKIEQFLSEVLPSSIKFRDFIFSPKSCRLYFLYQGYQIPQEFSHHFRSLLTQIKNLNLSEGGPNDTFCAIRNTVLNANNHYEILGLQTTASKEDCRQAYKNIVLQIHPDKNYEEPWHTQATELFKVIHAAYLAVVRDQL